jgi:hypothetical protein
MKLRFKCPHCIQTGNREIIQVEPTNEGWFEATCAAGHQFEASILYHDFQILFEIGINAIHDGYYREAIGSFAASYERFLEFFVRIVVMSSEGDAEEFDKAWRHIRNQSERQLGAFIFVHLMTYKESPLLLSDNQVRLRNNVIHKGTIPNRADCVKYGDEIMKIILSVLRRLWNSHQKEVAGSINTRMSDNSDKFPGVIFMPWMTLPTSREPPAEEDTPNLEALLDGVAWARELG